MKEFWDNRFAEENFAYGTTPNIFYKENIDKLTPGKIYMPGEGEGRNAVYAAKLGWEVHAVDFSESGRDKAYKLAEKENVKINYTVSDLSEYTPPEETFDAALIVFLHLPESLREEVHAKVVNSLKPGGTLIGEVFSKDQIKFSSGGPKNIDMLYSLEDIYNDFHSLNMESFSEETIELNEEPHHVGKAKVIRYVGTKE